MEKNIQVIPATKEQENQFNTWEEVNERLYEKYTNEEDGIFYEEELEENYNNRFPVFSQEQLDSVPSFYNYNNMTFEIPEGQKMLLLLGNRIDTATIDKNTKYIRDVWIDKDNKIIIEDKEKWHHLNYSDAIFDKVVTNKNSNIIMETNVNDLEVKGVTRPLQVNDPVVVQQNNTHYTGKIEKINEDGSSTIKVFNNREVKELTISNEDFNSIKPLFILDKEGKMVYTKFTYDEVTKALNSSEEIKTKFEKGNNPIMGLMLGNKSDVIPFEKKIDDKLAPVEGRLEIRRNENGEPVLSSDVKFKELNLERPVYGKTFDAGQLEKLNTTGELGLVEGFKTNSGKEFSLWVSVDKELNKVVTKRENDVYIGQIFGVNTTEEQKATLKKGEGIVLPLKNGSEYYFSVSAATKNANGLKSFTADKAKEFGLIPKEQKEEKKNSKTKGMKI